MGKTDAYAKDFMAHPDVFAEFFNLLFHRNGDDLIVDQNSLEEKDSGVTVVFEDMQQKVIERRNDLVRQVSLTDGKDSTTVLLCLEIQSFIRYEQPLQNCLCVAVRKLQAAQNLAQQNKKQHGKTWSPLRLMQENDRLPTILQAVLYLGNKSWDACASLQELESCPHKQLLKYLVNSPSHVISLVDLTDEEILSLKTELRALAIFIKHSKNRDKLQAFLATDPMLQHLSGDAFRLIKECTHINLNNEPQSEDNNMCKAINEMIEEEVRKRLFEKNEQIKKDAEQIKKDAEQIKKDLNP